MQGIPPKNALCREETTQNLASTRAFVHPLNQITHQQGTASNFGLEGIQTQYRSALFVNCGASQSLREDFNQHPSTTNASLTAAIAEIAQASNFGPDHIRSINPFIFATFDAFPGPNVGFFTMFTKDMSDVAALCYRVSAQLLSPPENSETMPPASF